MRIEFPYPEVPDLEVPAERLLGYYRPHRREPAASPDELTRGALAAPIASPRIGDLAADAKSTLIVVDDATRPTPACLLLPPLLEELHAAGVPKSAISFLMAYGSHRAMTETEKRRKLGAEVLHQYEVHDHNWTDESGLVDLGALDDGTPVVVNRRVAEAKLVIGLGHVVPHRTQGFSGGSKILLPGVAGRASLNHMHWQASQRPIGDVLGQASNPIRDSSNAFARKAKLRFIVNAILRDDGEVLDVVAGEPERAHLEGCRRAREIYELRLPRQADIVVIDSFPADVDLWQANKALFAAEPAVRQGGVVILVTPSPEGASKSHPNLVELGCAPPSTVAEWIREGKLHEGASAAALADGGRVICEKATGIMVSRGISLEDQRKLGFRSAPTPQEALTQAFGLVGEDAMVAVVHHGGEVYLTVDGARA